jgi:uncharacterized membrane protein YbhN (UPF0104 family)
MTRSVAKYTLKVALSAAALWLVFSQVNVSEVGAFVATLDWRYALLSVVSLHISHLFGAFRLHDYLRIDGQVAPLQTIIRLHYAGAMFNAFLPSSIGGDGYKAWALAQRFASTLMAMVHVMLSNRANGLLLLFVLLAALLLAHDGMRNAVPYYDALVVAGLLFIALTYHVAARLLWKESLGRQLRMTPYSLGVQGMMLLSVYFLLLAFDAPNQLDYLLIMLLSSVVSLLPISIGGIGLREALMLYAGPYLSLDPAQAVSFAAVFSVIHLSISVVGVGPYLMGGKSKEANQVSAP